MSTSETILFLGLPIGSFTIGYALSAVAARRSWSVPRAQMFAAGICFLVPLAAFFVLEFKTLLTAERGFGAALAEAAKTATVLALACVPLAPIPAFIGAQLAARVNT